MDEALVPPERIREAIIVFRGQRVILDRELAVLYGVTTKALKQAVRRNSARFPEDFMFVLSGEEFVAWRTQFVTSSADRKGLRYPPMAFTEHGVAMLSSVLNSERAVRVNIAILRAFIRLRQMIAANRDLARRLDELEKRYDAQFRVVFDAIRQLMAAPSAPPARQRPRIGFRVEEGRPRYRRAGRSRDREMGK
jgi:hypothetical protein